MALSSYALVSVSELKRHLNVSGTEKNTLIEDVISQASAIVEQYLDRQIVTRGAVTEYHTPKPRSHELKTRDWPIISITTIHEDTDWPRTYGAAYLLVDGTDFQAMKPRGLLRRTDSAGVRAWAAGFRAVKVVYSYGYATTDDVPYSIKLGTLKLCALLYGESTRQQFGVSGASDNTGNWTRFSAAQLRSDIKDDLHPERRIVFEHTAERDS